MADESYLSVALQALEKFFSNSSIWFWLFIFSMVLLICEHFGYVSVTIARSSISEDVKIFAIFCVCMLAASTNFHLKVAASVPPALKRSLEFIQNVRA
jgi:hypothetical protein